MRQFRMSDLRTVAGEPMEMISPGRQNTHAGPDFEYARLVIAGLAWSGNVEIHIRSSDWLQHGHQQDATYDTVILHVVYRHDRTILRQDGSEIPTLELNTRISSELIERYENLVNTISWIPCESSLHYLDPDIAKLVLPRLTVELLEERAKQVLALVDRYKGDWEEAFYIRLARNFGFNVNSEPFERLARGVPRTLFSRHLDRPEQVHALFFGVAGFLSGVAPDRYAARLQTEFQFLQRKYGLQTIDRFLWKFGRLRPANFPTRRIAQLATLLCMSPLVFSTFLAETDVALLCDILCSAEVPDYWSDHYQFGETSAPGAARLGRASAETILSNTVAPFLFAYGKRYGDTALTERGVGLLENLRPEDNVLIRKFKRSGLAACSMADTKALLHLKKMYCDTKNCLNCGIGNQLLGRER